MKFFIKCVMCLFAIAIAISATVTRDVDNEMDAHWGYKCQRNKCVRYQPKENGPCPQSFMVCRMTCGDEIGTLWPKPTGAIRKGQRVIRIDWSHIEFDIPTNAKSDSLWKMVKIRFIQTITNKMPRTDLLPSVRTTLRIKINLHDQLNDTPKLTLETDESYKLRITDKKKSPFVFADITAKTFFGARHGLETLSQLIVYDECGECFHILADTEINDAPFFKHRGILLDTARHYFSIKSIKRTIDGMSMNKFNIFHWHMIDSQSFPFVMKSHPEFHKLGAFSTRKVYTHDDITEVLHYALARGIRVIPEFDAIARAAAGWESTNMTICYNAQPWQRSCYFPPCGQLDPTIDELYNDLGDIYREMFNLFNSDTFHMGGIAPSERCWRNSDTISKFMLTKGWRYSKDGYDQLWYYFQNKTLAAFDIATKNAKASLILAKGPLWKYLDKDRFIMEIYKENITLDFSDAIKHGFRIIGNINLFPPRNWFHLYNFTADINNGSYTRLLLGALGSIWTYKVNEHTLDAVVWPQASALAENLWSNLKNRWQTSTSRLSVHVVSLMQNGIAAQPIHSEWCFLNDKEC